MNVKYRTVFLIGLAVALGGAWWIFGRGSHALTSGASANAPSRREGISSDEGKSGSGGQSPGPGRAEVISPDSPSNGLSKEETMRSIWAATNATSLDFYGRVEDQYGRDVPEVQVRAAVGLIVGFTRSGGKYYDTETDSRGNFSFIGIHGAGVGFFFKKEGYVYDQKIPSSRPDRYVPDAAHPMVFHIWKLKGPEPMIHRRIHAYIPCDGGANFYDLLTGRKVAQGGDLTVKLTRNPVEITRGTPFDWSVALSVTGGGLIESKDLYTNEAPAEGYQPTVVVDVPASASQWSPALTRTYYFKIRNGQGYGRMTIGIQADFQPPPTLFDVDIYVNPSGSRNLEFDPSKEIGPR